MKTYKETTENLRQQIRNVSNEVLRKLVWVLFIASLLASAPSARSTSVYGLKLDEKPQVDVMQVNLYVGAGLGRAVTLDPMDPQYFNNLIQTVTGIYDEILASAPPARLQRVACEIADRKPDIVSIEEASLIRIESPGDLVLGGGHSATNVVCDYLQILIDQLAKLGVKYTVVAVNNGLDVEMPMLNQQKGTFDDVRLTDREAILLRGDQQYAERHAANPQSGNFTNVVVTGTGLPLLYGWCSVDLHMSKKNFRYICVHLTEETAPDIQVRQAEELFAGPANTTWPVMIIGDFNADPLHRDGSVVYDDFIAAGFKDAWVEQHPTNPGGKLTWGHDELLADPGTTFDRRIDLVLYKGKMFKPGETKVDDLLMKRKLPPLWASDHAAVQTTFKFK